MKKIGKLFYYLYLGFISILVLVMVLGGGWWAVSRVLAKQYQKKINAAMPLFKTAVQVKADDKIRGCVYDKQEIVISFNHRYYFTIKDGQVKLLNLMHAKELEIFPDIPRDNDFMDLYWLLENCK